MIWFRIWFWVWVAMIPFATFMGYTNYVTNHTTLFWINVVTVVCASINAYMSHRTIQQHKQFRAKVNRFLNGDIDEV